MRNLEGFLLRRLVRYFEAEHVIPVTYESSFTAPDQPHWQMWGSFHRVIRIHYGFVRPTTNHLPSVQPGSRAARSSGTLKISRRPSLPAISSPRPANFCRSLRAV
jgi:hypothetical protein